MTTKHFRLLPLAAFCAASFSAHSAEIANHESLTDLESRINILESQQSSSLEDKLNFNGFASLNMQIGNNSHGFMKSDNSLSFEEGSLVGLQGEFMINDSTSAVVQLVARGTQKQNWNPDIEWAFISHQATSNLKIRGGKLRLPLFMYSDYLEVGYAQTGVRVPNEVYGPVVVTSLTGMDFIYDYELEDSMISLQGFVGSQKLEASKHSYNVDTQFDDIAGAVINWTDDTWTLRAVYAQATVDSSKNWNTDTGPIKEMLGGELLNTTFEDDKAEFYGLGGRYEDGLWSISSEVTRTTVEGFYSDIDAAYITAAYRIDQVTPYFTVSHMRSKDNDERQIVTKQVQNYALKAQQAQMQANGTSDPVQKMLLLSQAKKYAALATNSAGSNTAIKSAMDMTRTTYSVGARWDVMTNVALKGDISYMTDFDGTNGGLDSRFKNDDNFLYTVKLDVVF